MSLPHHLQIGGTAAPAAAGAAAASRHAPDSGSELTCHSRASADLRQDPHGSNSLRPVVAAAAASGANPEGGTPDEKTSAPLRNVGLVVWQAAFVLAEYLSRVQPLGLWRGQRVVELGAGTGVAGISLARRGAHVVSTDLPHVTPLLRLNAEANVLGPGAGHGAIEVVDHAWGSGDTASVLAPLPGQECDVLIGADVTYEEDVIPLLLKSIRALCSPHTVLYLAYKKRGLGEGRVGALLEEQGFHVSTVAAEFLHPEYQEAGVYTILRGIQLDGMETD